MNPAPPTIVQHAGDEFLIATTPSGHAIAVDVKGGRKSAPGPLELFVAGLGSCTASDVIAILRKKREQVTAYHVEIRTERREEHPRSFRRIELKHVIRGHNVSSKSVERAIELSTEKYCGAISTVRATAEVVTTYEVRPDENSTVLQPEP
ncbi:MAG: putative redox protein [Acidobacteriaceae bacterium]|nr:putative redox protein [Acidobacteriaceae bacterium]